MQDDSGKDGPDYGAVNAEAFRGEMDKVLVKWGLTPEDLSFVDDFPNELRPSKCFKIQKKIHFKRTITPEDRGAAISAMYQFEERERALLRDDWLFVKHTLLHEIRHILQRHEDDYACNRWAFYELKK